jgi:NADPH2:quinone reductase
MLCEDRDVRAAVVRELGSPPEIGEVRDPQASGGRAVLEVVAAGLNPIDVAVGAGRYFAGHPEVPYVSGAEAVARGDDGGLLYLNGDGLGVSRDGAHAERVLFASDEALPVPDVVEPELAAACGIAGLAGWLPFAWRAPVRQGETVLVLGATGTVGLVGVQAAKLLGAGRVVAVGRNEAALERAAELGADETVSLEEGLDLVAAFREACGGDGPSLVFDPLWGAPGAAAVEAAARGARIVNLGQSAGPEATLRSGDVRGKGLDLLGYTNFAAPREVREREYARLCRHAAAGDVRIDIEIVLLDELPVAWERQASSPNVKLVVTP